MYRSAIRVPFAEPFEPGNALAPRPLLLQGVKFASAVLAAWTVVADLYDILPTVRQARVAGATT